MAVKTYSYKQHKNIYCSTHTQVKEMRCKDGSDKILVSEELMAAVEKLFAKFRCSKYIITSGYRTPAYDIKVGGNGKGQHTLGKAVDAKFYDAKGKLIPAQIVCCVAQDLGIFNGIANIDKKYASVHLDVGSRAKKYLGDEIYGTNSVTTNFYTYFKKTKADIAKYTGELIPENYFKKYTGSTVSIVSALKSIGAESSFSYRSKIAKANGITGYRGSAKQNGKMLDLLEQGKLIKP